MSSVFSVDLKCKSHVRNISISDESHDRVLLEGTLGRLLEVSVIEGSALEFVGAHGTLRIEVDEDVLLSVFTCPCRRLSLSSEVGSSKDTNRVGENRE